MDMSGTPRILKANRVKGKTLIFHNATANDASFILSQRTDSNKAKHLSKVSSKLSQQIAWLEEYAHKEGQAYFIILNQAGESLGTIRLYGSVGNSFSCGSWIIIDGAPRSCAIESLLMMYSYATDYLGFRAAHFNVQKGNESVWHFHERFGAERVGEDDQEYFYKINFEQISSARQRYKRYLPNPVEADVKKVDPKMG